MNLELDGRAVFIAGASRGIGLAIAESFLQEGARVALTARTPEPLEQARARLAARYGTERVMAIAGDISQAEHLAAALDAAETRLGPLAAVIANVGSGRSQPGHDVDEAEWRRMLDVNFVGSMTLARAALNRFCDRGGGSLTFVSSIAGAEAIAAPVPYSAAKAALGAAAKNFARQVGGRGVRVNAVLPGNVYFPGGTWDRLQTEKPDWVRAYVAAEVPLQRLATPAEVADVVVFLSSARASFMTGSMVIVDGGQTRFY